MKLKKNTKSDQKNNSSQSGLTYETRNPGHEIRITQ